MLAKNRFAPVRETVPLFDLRSPSIRSIELELPPHLQRYPLDTPVEALQPSLILPFLSTLSLSCAQSFCVLEPSSSGIFFCKRFPNLKSLSLTGSTKPLGPDLLLSLPQLESLKLSADIPRRDQLISGFVVNIPVECSMVPKWRGKNAGGKFEPSWAIDHLPRNEPEVARLLPVASSVLLPASF